MTSLAVLAQEVDDRQLPLTSFGNEPLWLTIAKALFVFVLLVLMTLFSIVFERKVVARMQQRSGPNRGRRDGASPPLRLQRRHPARRRIVLGDAGGTAPAASVMGKDCWGERWDSNPRHPRPQPGALTT